MALLCFYHRHSCTRIFSFFKAHRWLLMVVFMASLFLIHVHSVPLLVTHHCLFCFVVTAWILCTLTLVCCVSRIFLSRLREILMHRANAAALSRQAWARLYGGPGHTAGARRRRAICASPMTNCAHSVILEKSCRRPTILPNGSPTIPVTI